MFFRLCEYLSDIYIFLDFPSLNICSPYVYTYSSHVYICPRAESVVLEHEYHFSNKFTLWFYALAVHIGRIRNKYKERSEIVRYGKQRQTGANFEHVYCMSVCGSRKKFGLENVKYFWKIRREQKQNTHRRYNALGESGTCVVCIFFAKSQTSRLSANLTGVGGRHGCCCGAVSRNLRRELRAESSRRRGCSPWASPSPRAKTFALGEERLHQELEVWLSPKLPALGEDSVSGSVSAPASFVTAYTTWLTLPFAPYHQCSLL
jgi:hypothetical protein